MNTVNRIRTSDVTAYQYSDENPVNPDLFLSARNFKTPDSEFAPGVHPRVAVGKLEWERIVNAYANDSFFGISGSWSSHFLNLTLSHGPDNEELQTWVSMDTNAYTGSGTDNAAGLKKLGDNVLKVGEGLGSGLFLYALHLSVDEVRKANGHPSHLKADQTFSKLATLLTNWAKVVLAHRATYGCEGCKHVDGEQFSELWDTSKYWEVSDDWFTGGLGLALSYDVIYDRLSVDQRRTIRSALALIVHKRWSWGLQDWSDRKSPNVVDTPHRIFSNWAMYHANLYLTNLAIEGETDFDSATRAVLGPGKSGFNKKLNDKWPFLAKAYMAHSVYPDGSTFEDGYTYGIAMRESTLAFIALARRGHNEVDTPRFRNFIHNAAQNFEPWQCGSFVGHASGGGNFYQAFHALARYVYPDGPLPQMMWRQRMGSEFINNAPCRIQWHQTVVQMAILGGEHAMEAGDSPGTLPSSVSSLFQKSFYASRRGLLIGRSSLDEDAIYMHFDARPDAFFVGHDNADRGVFTFSALKRTWFADLDDWESTTASTYHSLMHVDGQAQRLKAPSVRMMKVLEEEDGNVLVAAADLLYAYNTQWGPGSLGGNVEKETGSPRDFGWPADDSGEDIGFADDTQINGEPDVGFSGLYVWKRAFRKEPLTHAVRSMAIVRDTTEYALIVDSFGVSGSSSNHTFESRFILGPDVSVQHDLSSCTANSCKIVLKDNNSSTLDLHILTLGSNLNFKTISLPNSNGALLVESAGQKAEEFWCVLHPHRGHTKNFSISKKAGGSIVEIKTDVGSRQFEVGSHDHTLSLGSHGPNSSTAAKTAKDSSFRRVPQSEPEQTEDPAEETDHELTEELHAENTMEPANEDEFLAKEPTEEQEDVGLLTIRPTTEAEVHDLDARCMRFCKNIFS